MEELGSNTTGMQKSSIKPLSDENSGQSGKKSSLILVVVVLLGILTGFGLYKVKTNGTVLVAGKNIEVVKTTNEEGVKDAATFRDTAEGKLIVNDGKITDEGTHVLDRGADSQNVYLISTVVDLDKFKGKKVQVWGETYKGQKAGWLMDVGRIKVQ